MDLNGWDVLNEQAVDTQKALKKLVKSFSSEDGLPREVYEATHDLLEAQMGIQAAWDFERAIDADDGQFYFQNSADCQHTIQKIFGFGE